MGRADSDQNERMSSEVDAEINTIKEGDHETTLEVDRPVVGKWAPWSEVKKWFKISAAIAAIMLVGVVLTGALLQGDASEGSHSQLLGEYGDYYMYYSGAEAKIYSVIHVFNRNLLVLLLHFFCCLVGAIIGRETYKTMQARVRRGEEPNAAPDEVEEVIAEDEEENKVIRTFERWNTLPKWVADLALVYAATATLASIAVQTIGIGYILTDISAYTGLTAPELGLLILPHAPLELIAVFLPLGLFLIQTRKHELAPLGKWSVQSFLIGLPLIFIAAIIEVYVSPELISKAITWNGGLPDIYSVISTLPF